LNCMSKELINHFYHSFQQKNWQAMQSCYHDRATFTDPVFQQLSVREVRAMWHMLASAGQDLRIDFTDVASDEKKGSCHWEAWYSFSRTGRKVHNIIDASFEFEGEKIIRHADSFDLWHWSGMALGLSGKLLGWSPFVRNKIRATAKKSLLTFVRNHPEYQ
jgi:hypothetical protein